MAERLEPLLALGPFKGLNFSSSDPVLEPGYGVYSTNANVAHVKGALLPELGRVQVGDFSSYVGRVTMIFSYIGPQDAASLVIQGTLGTALYSLAGTTTQLTNAMPFTQAVQYGAVMYTNGGQRLFSQSYQFYDWQYPAPVALNNYALTATTGSLAAATYFYTFTRTTTMPDSSISETSVDLNQYAANANVSSGITLSATGGVIITPTNGLLWTGTNDDGTTFTTNVYRQSTLQSTYLLLANLTTNAPYTDTIPDSTIINNAQLVVSRDVPPVNADNFGSICIHKNRIWCFVTIANRNTNNLPQVQLWYSNVDRVWEFDLTSQVLLLQSDITSVPPVPNRYNALYGNDPKGMAEVGSILACFKKREVWAVYGDDSSSFIARTLFGIGCVSRGSITPAAGGVYWDSEFGPYFWDGSAPQYIGAKVRGYLRPTPGFSGRDALPGVTPAQRTNGTGSFRDLTWYLSFPDVGQTLPYDSATGEWLTVLPYAPYTFSAISSVSSEPTVYANPTTLNAIYAARNTAAGIIDAWFQDAANDLGVPATMTWTSAFTDSGMPSYEKWYRYLTLYAPVQQGTATVTLTLDPGMAGKTPFVWVVDLSKSTRPITSIAPDFRGFISQLSISVTGVAGAQPPQIWGVYVWGQASRNLVPPV